jgi:hypothetical protein
MLGISWVAAQLVASHEAVSSMKSVRGTSFKSWPTDWLLPLENIMTKHSNRKMWEYYLIISHIIFLSSFNNSPFITSPSFLVHPYSLPLLLSHPCLLNYQIINHYQNRNTLWYNMRCQYILALQCWSFQLRILSWIRYTWNWLSPTCIHTNLLHGAVIILRSRVVRKVSRRFGGPYWLHHRDSQVNHARKPAWNRQQVEFCCSSEASIGFHPITRHYNPEDRKFVEWHPLWR